MPEPKRRLLDPFPVGGDGYEATFWPRIAARFPNYEAFWANVIWDLTLRGEPGARDGDRLQLRPWLPRELQLLCQSHYTVFRSVVFIEVSRGVPESAPPDLRMVLENERMKNVYMHFGIIGDMANRMATIIQSLPDRVAGVAPQRRADSELLEAFRIWSKETYPEEFHGFVESFRPVNFAVHGRGDGIGQLIDKQIRTRYAELFAGRLVRYRNLIHNPDAGRIFDGQRFWVPKPQYIRESSLWTEMRASFQREFDKFEDLDESIGNDLNETLRFLNDFWPLLLTGLEKIQSDRRYGAWIEQARSTYKPLETPPVFNTEHATATSISPSAFAASSGDGSFIPPLSGNIGRDDAQS